MAKSSEIEVNLHAIHQWLQLKKLRLKVTKIQSILLTVVVFASCSASLLTMILTHPSFLDLYQTATRESVFCDFSNFCTSICQLRGDVRVKSSNLTVALFSANHTTSSTPNHHVIGKIRPYTRKWEKMMKTIGEVNMIKLPSSSSSRMVCDVRHSVPAVIFSTGGYTGNLYHDFSDGFVPLYITAERFKGEVIFMVLEFRDWWPHKYREILKQLTHYPVIDLNQTQQVHCFPEVVVGLKTHGSLLINPAAMEDRRSMADFQSLLAEALNPRKTILPKEKPRLVLVTRENSRVIVNQNETIELAERLGFEVRTFQPNFHTKLSEIYPLINSADVFIGVHGAALTHFLFMRPNSTFIQIIPFGLDGPAKTCFGEAAPKAGLHYMAYQLLPSESTLSETFGLNHTVLVNPDEYTAKGWQIRKKIYLDGQNIRLSLPRLEQILTGVLKRLQEVQDKM